MLTYDPPNHFPSPLPPSLFPPTPWTRLSMDQFKLGKKKEALEEEAHLSNAKKTIEKVRKPKVPKAAKWILTI